MAKAILDRLSKVRPFQANASSSTITRCKPPPCSRTKVVPGRSGVTTGEAGWGEDGDSCDGFGLSISRCNACRQALWRSPKSSTCSRCRRMRTSSPLGSDVGKGRPTAALQGHRVKIAASGSAEGRPRAHHVALGHCLILSRLADGATHAATPITSGVCTGASGDPTIRYRVTLSSPRERSRLNPLSPNPVRAARVVCGSQPVVSTRSSALAPVGRTLIRRAHPSIFNAAMKASCGISTLPNCRIFFLPAFCFSSSLRLRVTSPP